VPVHDPALGQGALKGAPHVPVRELQAPSTPVEPLRAGRQQTVVRRFVEGVLGHERGEAAQRAGQQAEERPRERSAPVERCSQARASNRRTQTAGLGRRARRSAPVLASSAT